jgi:sterol desaturase/sphingolipid hydroxylase (fatty acid hydroxylase superfamily)
MVGLSADDRFLRGLVLLDFTFYFWHYANHRVPLLWRFHVVHHIDPDLDVSTAFRFHFGEVALSAAFRVVQIALIGAPPLAVMIYEFLFQANTLFHHSNVRLPIRVERALNWILVTPRMHGIHHSMVRQENTSNFSVVFSIWDRLRGTATLNVPQQEIVIGIPAYEKSSDNAVATLLTLPFRHQPDAWRRADGSAVTRERARSDVPVRVLAA